MKKDKKWALKEVDRYLSYEGVNEARDALLFAKGVIDQLDEPEVLSQNWIDEHEIHYNHWVGAVPVTDLQNLLVPKQELPVIPKFVADWITEYRKDFDLYPALKKLEDKPAAWKPWKRIYEWYRMNTHQFVNAYLTGEYEVGERELTVKGVIEKHIELLKKQKEAVNLKPYYDLLEELKDE